MNKRSKRPRQRTHCCRENEQDGILSPSGKLFNKMNQEVTLHSLKEDVISSIRNRESLINRTRELLVIENAKSREKVHSKINDEAKSNHFKKRFRALHNASLCVVEAIIKIDLMSLECRESTNGEIQNNNYTFCWMGQNYLTKMISDLQFICNFKEMMAILLPEKKSLYRNPFLIALDMDEVVGYDPDTSSSSSELKKARMTRTSWDINLPRIKHAASRILFEEHRAVYGYNNAIHVFPKSTNERGRNYIDITLPPSPQLDPKELEAVITSEDLKFDDALVIACVRLLLGCDIKGVEIKGQTISKHAVYKLARQPYDIITQELFAQGNDVKIIWVEKKNLHNIYMMLIRNLFKEELLTLETSRPLYSLKTWLFNVVSKEWEMKGSVCMAEGNELNARKNNDHTAGTKTNQTKRSSHAMSKKLVLISQSDSINDDNDMKPSKISVSNPSISSEKDYTDGREEKSPVPLWITVSIPQGGHKVNVTKGKLEESICIGDIVRIGHPYHSGNYTVSKVDDSCFFITEAFVNQTSMLQHQSKEDSTMISTSFSSEIDNKENLQHNIASSVKAEPSSRFQKNDKNYAIDARVWKIVNCSDDQRLEWRKDYDNGFVPWFPTTEEELQAHFRIKLHWKDVEKYCNNSVCDPDYCVHQQRLHYFEKVSLDDIIRETYESICHSWHPITPMIDNVKWAKLARTMKFLSNVKNANHEVDMAFFRHSHQRKLDLKRFKAVLLDMALQKYSSSKYCARVSYIGDFYHIKNEPFHLLLLKCFPM